MARNLLKAKGRKDKPPFLGLQHRIITSDNFKALSSKAVKLLIVIGGQFRGGNNGDLSATHKMMKPYGFASDTLSFALMELEHYGFIDLTRQGGKNQCNLYAITWESIDECNGKLDVNPTRVASNRWMQQVEPYERQRKITKPKRAPKRNGQRKPEESFNAAIN